MGWPEKHGAGWRACWRGPDGRVEHLVGFSGKKAAKQYADGQTADIRAGRYLDPNLGRITLTEWSNLWYAGLDLELSTMDNYRRHLELYILPSFGHRSIAAILPEEVQAWETELVRAGHARRSVYDYRSTFRTCLGDAVPGRIARNPAERGRPRGKKAERRVARAMSKRRTWATPMDVFGLGERLAVLSGCDEDFVKAVAIGWTGMRWSEATGLLPGCVHDGRWSLDWKLYELDGRFYRGRPKDGSVRDVDIPPFLDDLIMPLVGRGKVKEAYCTCARDAEEPYCSGGAYVFLGPGRGHARRSDYSRRFFRPAADGRFPASGRRPAVPVLADVSASWPGLVLPPHPAAVAGESWEPPSGGRQRRPAGRAVNSRSSKAELVAYGVASGQMSEASAGELTREQLLDVLVRGDYLSADAPLTGWLPIRAGLTPHGLRVSHETWLAEARIPDVLRDERLGHTLQDEEYSPIRSKTMRDHYTRSTDTMRSEMVELLQRLWEQTCIARVEQERLSGLRSSVPIVNEVLEPFRTAVTPIARAVQIVRPREPRSATRKLAARA